MTKGLTIGALLSYWVGIVIYMSQAPANPFAKVLAATIFTVLWLTIGVVVWLVLAEIDEAWQDWREERRS